MSKYSESTNNLIIASAYAMEANGEWRWGQAIVNTATEWYPQILKSGIPGYLNPFNDDSRVDVFLHWLKYEQDGTFGG